MEVKGTSPRGTIEFVNKHFPERKQEWLNSLPDSSRELMSGLILTNQWYSLNDALILPIHQVGQIFYDGDDRKTAYIMGSFHAEQTLTGIYKFFVQINTPWYIINKGIGVFSNYFRPCKLDIVRLGKTHISISIKEFPGIHEIVESSIEGWTKRAIEISGGKNIETSIPKSITRNDSTSEIIFKWD
jgi:hypothetical protein